MEDQDNRYDRIRERYGKDVHIHHRESAFYVDEIHDGIFFISCEPNNLRKIKPMTVDYFDVGFVLNGPPFSRVFNEFFKRIDIEPFVFKSNRHKFISTKIMNLKKR